MTSRRKLTVTLTVVALVVVAAVVAVVGVLAATQQTVNSAINITFTAVDIDGTVSAKYLVQDKKEIALVGANPVTVEGIKFTAAGTQTGSLAIASDGSIELKGQSEALYVAYQFTRQEINYNVTASFDNTVFKMEYYREADAENGIEAGWVEVAQSPVTVLNGVSDGANGTSLITRFYVKDAKASITNAVTLGVSFVLTGTTHTVPADPAD